MSRRLFGRMLTAATLAATLALATPAHAVSLGDWTNPTHLLLRAWEWLAGAGHGGSVTAAPGSRQRLGKGGMDIDPNGLPLKAGYGVDPNGLQSPGATTSSTSSDSGFGVDPNG